jgi:hypothetical protein
MNSARREKLERALKAAEANFRAELLAALHSCAAGQQGLFGHGNAASLPSWMHERLAKESGAGVLLELGREIDVLRATLGIAEAFNLLARYRELYGPHTAQNDLGERRLAETWLAELRG